MSTPPLKRWDTAIVLGIVLLWLAATAWMRLSGFAASGPTPHSVQGSPTSRAA